MNREQEIEEIGKHSNNLNVSVHVIDLLLSLTLILGAFLMIAVSFYIHLPIVSFIFIVSISEGGRGINGTSEDKNITAFNHQALLGVIGIVIMSILEFWKYL